MLVKMAKLTLEALANGLAQFQDAAGAAISKPKARGEGAVVGFLAGMLVGAILGDSDRGPRRILAVHYDPATGQWCGYDGGLVPYMKERLAHPQVIGDLPRKMSPRRSA